MGLRINNNVAAMNAYRNLSVNDGAMSKSLERLSSGLRINRAADDAAGLSVSEGRRPQRAGRRQRRADRRRCADRDHRDPAAHA
jgi:flagellin